VRDVDLPGDLATGDVLAVPATGAYGRSMASNYNLFTRPGVAWVDGGRQGWVLRPETIEDLLRLEGDA
jgi:diaminopimelate decarboxylase